ncbi:MAG: site-specific integrase [Oscillospiraceae bacterium]|nr:site-specific integrase [Oscillospiraceae bacterium]
MKVPEPKKLPSGNWFIQMRLGGESISVTRSTAKECKRAAELIKAEYRAENRANQGRGSITLEKAIEKYCADKENALSPATINGYYCIKRNRFKSVMQTPLKDIKNWQAVVNGELRTKSPKTVENAWFLVATILRYNGMEVPKVSLAKVVENDLPWLEPDDIKKFVSSVKGHKHEIDMLLALHSLRRSEIVALDWSNVDLENELVYVRGAMVYNKDGKLVEKKQNKSDKSRRVVHLMIPQLVDAMKAVPDKTGKVVQCAPNTIYRNINAVCERVGLEKVGVHGLRRSFASLAYSLKWSAKHTQEAGGWKNESTMQKFYIKLSAKDKNEDVANMEGFFKQSIEKQNANENANQSA